MVLTSLLDAKQFIINILFMFVTAPPNPPPPRHQLKQASKYLFEESAFRRPVTW